MSTIKTDIDSWLNQLEEAPTIYHPSPFWRELIINHIDQLERAGFENFKRTINTKYFNWTIPGIIAHQFLPLTLNWLSHPDISVFSSEFPNYDQPRRPDMMSLNPATAWIYKIYLGMLANLVTEYDTWELLQQIEEPLLGNPWRINYRRQWISQDLCNSIFEFYSALDHTAWGKEDAIEIAELGAGYGRLAYIFLSALPNAKYTIIDIPPALYVSQRYLSTVFPDETIFGFREFKSYSSIEQEYEASRIRFLMPHQIELFPDNQFDLLLSISTFHEMTLPQINHYFSQINRLGRGRFYTKQWLKSRAEKQNKIVIREEDYPIPTSWTLLRRRRHPIQSWFFDALYEIPSA